MIKEEKRKHIEKTMEIVKKKIVEYKDVFIRLKDK